MNKQQSATVETGEHKPDSAPLGGSAAVWKIKADERRKCAAGARAAFADPNWNSMYRQAAESIATGLEESAAELERQNSDYPTLV